MAPLKYEGNTFYHKQKFVLFAQKILANTNLKNTVNYEIIVRWCS